MREILEWTKIERKASGDRSTLCQKCAYPPDRFGQPTAADRRLADGRVRSCTGLMRGASHRDIKLSYSWETTPLRGKHMKSVMAIAAAFIATATITAQAAAAPATTDDAQIKALENQFSAAFNAKDVDAIMKVYVPDSSMFVFDVGTPRQYVGAKAYRKDWQDFLATFKGPIKVDLSDIAVSTDGTIGYGHDIQHVSGTDMNGKPSEFTVRVTDAYRKIDGKWLIVQEHVSVPVDFATGKPDMMSKP